MKKIVSILIVTVMLFSMAHSFSLHSLADVPISIEYVDAENNKHTQSSYQILDGTEEDLYTGWYVVSGEIFSNERITVHGDVNIIICDNSQFYPLYGITVEYDNSLTIWTQSHEQLNKEQQDSEGIMMCGIGSAEGAGIGSLVSSRGCGQIVFNGSTSLVVGNSVGIGDCPGGTPSGKLIINNGEIEVGSYNPYTDDEIAGIDGVYIQDIVVNGGAITAYGNRYGINVIGDLVENEGYVHSQTGGIFVGGMLKVNSGRFSLIHSINGEGDWNLYAGRGITLGLKTEVSEPLGAIVGENTIIDDEGNSIKDSILISPITGPRFRGHSVTLTDEIGIDFYLVLPDGADYPGSYMEFVTGDKVISRVNLTEASLEASGKYRFTCFISSIQMADKITPKFHYGEGTEIGESYSVCDYLDYVIDNKADYTSKLIDLVKAIADYGHYAQIRLSQLRGWTYGVDYKTIPRFTDDALNVTAVRTAVASNTVSKTIDDTVINKITYSMDFLSNPMIYLYVEPVGSEIDGFSASEGSKTLDWEIRSDGRYRIKVNAGMIDRIHNTHTVTIKSGDSTVATVTFSGLSYIKSALDYCALHPGDPESSPEENFMTAFYRFHSAARAYTSN